MEPLNANSSTQCLKFKKISVNSFILNKTSRGIVQFQAKNIASYLHSYVTTRDLFWARDSFEVTFGSQDTRLLKCSY